jgi:peptidoglycan/LPS O-acetylase OafA/YrhL
MKKLMYLEALRGLAALIVVFHHYLAAFYPYATLGGAYRPHETWERWFLATPLGFFAAAHFAVCLFFILSGYVLSLPFFGSTAKDDDSLLAALVKRPFRLVGLVIASELLAFVLLKLHWYFNVEASAVTHSAPWFREWWMTTNDRYFRLFWDFLTRPFEAGASYNPPLWTIRIELYGSFIVFIFLLLFRRNRLKPLAYLVALLMLHRGLYMGFLIGVMLADFSRNCPDQMEKHTRSPLSPCLLVVGIFFASFPFYAGTALQGTVYVALPNLPLLDGGYSMLGAILIFIGVLLGPRTQALLSWAPLQFLGRISYALYAFHFLLLGSFSAWLFLKLMPSLGYNSAFLWTFAVSLVILLVASHLISLWIDAPVTRLANFIGSRWTQSVEKDRPPGIAKEG